MQHVGTLTENEIISLIPPKKTINNTNNSHHRRRVTITRGIVLLLCVHFTLSIYNILPSYNVCAVRVGSSSTAINASYLPKQTQQAVSED